MSDVNVKGASSIEDAVSEILGSAEYAVMEASYQASKKAAQETVKDLKKLSPKRRAGKYAKGWKAKKQDNGYVVFNSVLPGYTQLLEKGHDVVKNGKKVGRARAIPHIKPAEVAGEYVFEQEARKEIERRLSK